MLRGRKMCIRTEDQNVNISFNAAIDNLLQKLIYIIPAYIIPVIRDSRKSWSLE